MLINIKSFKYVSVSLIAFLLATSCAKQVVVLKTHENRSYESEATIDHDFFLEGPFQEKNFALKRFCDSKDNVHSFQGKRSFTNSAIALFSLGFLTPREVQIFCIDKNDDFF